MQLSSIGDLARTITTQNRSGQLRDAIGRLTQELTSGQVHDTAQHLGGDLRRLIDIEHARTKLDGYRVAIGEAGGFANAIQANLDNVYGLTIGLGETLVSFGQSTAAQTTERIRNQSREGLDEIVSRLNSTAVGRSLFAGIQTDAMPIAAADDILGGLRAVVAGETTAAGVVAAADAWFDDPAGFVAAFYSGSDTDLAPVRVGEFDEVSLALRADDPAFRAVLRDFALNVLATDGSVLFDPGERNAYFADASVRAFSNASGIVGLQADVGYGQERLEEARTRHEAERTSLNILRANLVQADPYETAISLENAQFQLESLYAVTVRTSQLSLVGFLR